MSITKEEIAREKQLADEINGGRKEDTRDGSLWLKAYREQQEENGVAALAEDVKKKTGRTLRLVVLNTQLQDNCPYNIHGYLYFLTSGDSVLAKVPVLDKDDWESIANVARCLPESSRQTALHELVSNGDRLKGNYVERVLTSNETNPLEWREGVGAYTCTGCIPSLFPLEIACEYCDQVKTCKRA
jgi:hypothetical protein